MRTPEHWDDEWQKHLHNLGKNFVDESEFYMWIRAIQRDAFEDAKDAAYELVSRSCECGHVAIDCLKFPGDSDR